MNEHPFPNTSLPSYADAQFLEQLNDDDFWRYAITRAYSVPVVPLLFEEYLVCDPGQGCYLLPLAMLGEVIASPQRFTLLPATPMWMLGVTIWRGTPLAVVDLGAYLAKRAADSQHASGLLLVAQHNDITLGLCVPVVGSITNLPAERLEPPEQITPGYILPCAGAIKGAYRDMDEMVGMDGMNDLLLLDIPVILADIVQHIRMTASYG